MLIESFVIALSALLKAGFIGFKSSLHFCREGVYVPLTSTPCWHWGARGSCVPQPVRFTQKQTSVLSWLKLEYFSLSPLSDLKCLNKSWRHLHDISLTVLDIQISMKGKSGHLAHYSHNIFIFSPTSSYKHYFQGRTPSLIKCYGS